MKGALVPHVVWRDLLTLDPDDPELHWQSFRAGVDILPINGDPKRGCFCALLRYARGAVVAHHKHSGHEHLLILRGEQTDERGTYKDGTFLINMPQTSHRVVSGDEGCLVLAIWESPVKFS